MTAETMPNREAIPTEVLNHLDEKTAFVTRFLLDPRSLNPDYDYPAEAISDAVITPSEAHKKNFYCADRAAAAECTDYWEKQAREGGPTSYEDQLNAWIKDSAATLVSTEHAASVTKLKAILQTTGDITYADQLTSETAENILEKIQQKYFQSNREITLADGTTETLAVDTHKFVTDTLAAYRTNNNLNTERLFKDLDDIKWFCRIFGDQHMDQIMADITAAVAEQEKYRAEILKKANTKIGGTLRINKPNIKPPEGEELTYLSGYAKPDYLPETAPPPPEPPKVVPIPLDTKPPKGATQTDGENSEGKKKELANKIAAANKEIFEDAGKRDRTQMTTLIHQVEEEQNKMLKNRKGTLDKDSTKIKDQGLTDIVCDGDRVYIPTPAADIIHIADMPVDAISLKALLDGHHFVENMESGQPKNVLIFSADFLNKGVTEVGTVEAFLVLKRRYPENVFIMRSTYEPNAILPEYRYPRQALNHYYPDGLPEGEFSLMKPLLTDIIHDEPSLQPILAQKANLEAEILRELKGMLTHKEGGRSSDNLYYLLTSAPNTAENRNTLRDKMRQDIYATVAENTSVFKAELQDKVISKFPTQIIAGKGSGEVIIDTAKADPLALANVPIEAIAQQLSITNGARQPRPPEQFFAPAVGNMFNDEDAPTLAGKIITTIYPQLVERPDQLAEIKKRAKELLGASTLAVADYETYVTDLQAKRQTDGKPDLSYSPKKKAGENGFYRNEDGGVSHDFMYYFKKSTTQWKNQNEPQVRAYITLSLNQIGAIQRHFVDLATLLYDQGIDFTAKAASPAGVARRSDNMLFYIADSDQPKAADIIKKFLSEKNICQGHVAAAVPSPQEGLSWAREPTAIHNKIWQEVSGSSQTSSFNTLVATLAMPTYLDRLSQAHTKAGNTDNANTYKQESDRVKAIITRYLPPT